MSTVADLLLIIEGQKTKSIRQLAKETEIPEDKLHAILTELRKHNLVDYDLATGTVALPKWLLNIDKKVEKERPAVGQIILPRNKEIQIQDTLIGNYTTNDLELKVRLRAKLKEIALCNIT
ncbi:MAG: hypothetical protein QXX79_05425 [Candidatus Bathyarchaeia archaeon]